MKNEIFKLKNEHPHWGYQRIANVIGCSKNTVKYWLCPTEPDANRKRKQRRHPLEKKISRFCGCDGNSRLKSKRQTQQIRTNIPLAIEIARQTGRSPADFISPKIKDYVLFP